MNSERNQEVAAFLEGSGFGAWRREPFTGDASTRSFERLVKDGVSLVLINAPLIEEAATPSPDATAAERIAAGYNAMARLSASRAGSAMFCCSRRVIGSCRRTARSSSAS